MEEKYNEEVLADELSEEISEEISEDVLEVDDVVCEDFVASYLNTIAGFEVLSPKEEKKLIKLAQAGDKEAKEKFLTHNLKLSASVAKKYARVARSLAYEDLIMEGNIGLMRALETFDLNMGYKFSTYAIWWIRQAITRAIMNTDSGIRIPVHLLELSYKVDKLIRAKESQVQRTITPSEIEEIINSMDITKDKKYNLFNVYKLRDQVSLDCPVGKDDDDSDSVIGDFLEDSDSSIEDKVVFTHLSEDLRKLIDEKLSAREKIVIKRRFGLDGYSPETLEMIGNDMKVTRERIRQIETKAIRKLRSPSSKRFLEDYAS